jgi:Raf kinase inhibitor-like YbhB/YbcL family protein
MTFEIKSPAFDGDTVPPEFTCDGGDHTPPIDVSDPPDGTRSFAIVMDDPDAPRGTFTHWLAYDIPPGPGRLAAERGKTLPNDFGRTGYGGPCPPRGHGPHRYFLTVYAVDVPSLDVKGSSRRDLEEA